MRSSSTVIRGAYMLRLLTKLTGVLVVFVAMSSATADETGEWYYPEWLAKAPHTPVFQVRDTVNKYGRYAAETKTVNLGDLIKYHGHFCGGLVESALSLSVAFNTLFADGVIDRTDLKIASNNSACGGDVAAYLTGARTRFGSHVIDPKLKESDFVVQKVSTRQTVRVSINVKTYPHDVRTLMRKIELGEATPENLDRFQALQWAYARKLVNQPGNESVVLVRSPDYVWPKTSCGDMGRRRDNDYKLTPQKASLSCERYICNQM